MYKLASKLITTAGMYTLYCSLFQPYISYSNEIWCNNYASNVKCLCVIQRKADRLAHTNELYKELYILKFPECVGVDHDKVILLSTPFPTIPILGKNCCCGVIVFYVGNKRCCIVLYCINTILPF